MKALPTRENRIAKQEENNKQEKKILGPLFDLKYLDHES